MKVVKNTNEIGVVPPTVIDLPNFLNLATVAHQTFSRYQLGGAVSDCKDQKVPIPKWVSTFLNSTENPKKPATVPFNANPKSSQIAV